MSFQNKPSCLSCSKRKKQCDSKRPRCSPCSKLHLKCIYLPNAPVPLVFKDETLKFHIEESHNVKLTKKNVQYFNNLDSEGFMAENWSHNILSETALFLDLFEFTNDSQLLLAPPLSATASSDILCDHFLNNLAGAFSSKNPRQTFYTHIFNKYTVTHPFLLTSILAWSSASICQAKSTIALSDEYAGDAISRFNDSMVSMNQWLSEKLTISTSEDIISNCPEMLTSMRFTGAVLSELKTDDKDALFSAIYFLLQYCIIRNEPQQAFVLLNFIAQVLHYLHEKNIPLVNIHARVATWISVVDMRAAFFSPHLAGKVIDCMMEIGLVEAAVDSKDLIERSYWENEYDKEEEEIEDNFHLPLLILFLQSITLMRRISSLNKLETPAQLYAAIENFGIKIKSYEDTVEPINRPRRISNILQINKAMYYSLQIYYSIVLEKRRQPYSKSNIASEIIRISENLTRTSSIPPTKIWPIPLFFAMLEIEDPIYLAWCNTYLKQNITAGENYCIIIEFVKKARSFQDQNNVGINDLSSIMDMNIIL